MNRIVGLETEYGCLSADDPGVPAAIASTTGSPNPSTRLGKRKKWACRYND